MVIRSERVLGIILKIILITFSDRLQIAEGNELTAR